jgi:hypothetical protein
MIFITPISILLAYILVLIFTAIPIAKLASADVTTLAYVVVVCGHVISVHSMDTSHLFLLDLTYYGNI